MPDMLVNLLKLPKEGALLDTLRTDGIEIRRAVSPDRHRILPRIAELMGPSAASECEACFARVPVSLFIATQGAQILGFAAYNATAPDFFGPTSVAQACRGKGIGKALLIRALRALREEGYVYAVIGGVGPAAFYAAAVGATLIADSDPGIYEDFLGRLESISPQT
jgi:GNAT superfamily N-acetyltransferase